MIEDLKVPVTQTAPENKTPLQGLTLSPEQVAELIRRLNRVESLIREAQSNVSALD